MQLQRGKEQGDAVVQGLYLLGEEMRVSGESSSKRVSLIKDRCHHSRAFTGSAAKGYLSSPQSDPELLRKQTSFSAEYHNSIFPGEKKKKIAFHCHRGWTLKYFP